MNKLCYLCTQQKADDSIGHIDLASDEAKMMRLKEIIEKHFWLRIDNDALDDSFVCGPCWEQLLLFHNFYEKVEQAHKVLQANAPMVKCEQPEREKEKPRESVAEAVKTRRRGRPRKASAIEVKANEEELKAVLEQINLNEIKIEYPEADLTMADVLEDEEDDDDEAADDVDEHDNEEEFEHDDVNNNTESEEEEQEEEEDLKIEQKPKSKKQQVKKVAKKKRGRPRGSVRGRVAKRPMTATGVTIIEKSREFNEYLREHYKVQCSICSKPQEGFSELLVHMRQEHKQRGYAMCCNRKFYKRGVLVDHLQHHQNPELFKCHICNRVMGQRRSLELHMRMHEVKERGRLYQCDVCMKSFYSLKVCDRHKLTHIPKELWNDECPTCGKTFPNRYTMQQHVKLVHLNLYCKMCEICGKSIRGREALARHMEEHAGAPQKVIKCDLCDSILTNKYGLARHIKMMHTEENLQPMQCEYCLKISPSLQSHQHHIKYTHKTARTHQCPMCEKAFKRPNELKEHMTTHTGEVLYTCPHCTQTFNSNANMHAHRKKMHRKEWEENRQQRMAKNRKSDSIIAVSVRKTTEARGQNDEKNDDIDEEMTTNSMEF
ncbi:transcription factor grauzone [Drosophila willistoni]|uniref:transcription factor grauzone n=1 Tax=Drosophila willistoni TaxID=7260 RepID=UPI000C26CB5C|nr:transcription factor grauzone [Drosophila willistoni]